MVKEIKKIKVLTEKTDRAMQDMIEVQKYLINLGTINKSVDYSPKNRFLELG